MNRSLLRRSFREAIVTLLAALTTMFCALALAPEPGPMILAVVLCLSLSRSQLDRDLRGRIEAAIALPVVSLAAIGVTMLLHHLPWLGAVAFVLAIAASIWLRRFGPVGRKAGILIALPFVVILVTPYAPPRHISPALALMAPVIVALLALFWVSLFHALGQRLRWLPATPPKLAELAAATSAAKGLQASDRMALQMAVALGAAFVVGQVFFEKHWAWVVLTAFIVSSGNQGRLDVVYKSLLRVLGAAAGTFIALLAAVHIGGHGPSTVALMLAALFMGIWLRPIGYAWWALFVTLALALLQGFQGAPTQDVLWPRLEEICIGALIAIAAAWFVLPVRASEVLRKRMADALAALSEALDPATPERSAVQFLARLDAVETLAPAFRAMRFATQRWRPLQPADWIDALLACRSGAEALIESGEAPGPVRKAVGAARKAMREPESIQQALVELRKALAPSA
ncbi:MAG TPA: FUSC family protein [Burkholderiaceae bacterium]